MPVEMGFADVKLFLRDHEDEAVVQPLHCVNQTFLRYRVFYPRLFGTRRVQSVCILHSLSRVLLGQPVRMYCGACLFS